MAAAVVPLATVAAAPAQAPAASDALAAYEEAARPVAEHQRLSPLVGRFKQTGRWFFPGQPPLEVAGETDNRFILGGRFVECRAKAKAGGIESESVSLFGFDRRRAEYFALGLDTLGTYYIHPWGRYDAARSAFILRGDEEDEASGTAFQYEFQLRLETPDRYVFELWFEFPGQKPMKVVELVHTRI
jgi:hypothetical protein